MKDAIDHPCLECYFFEYEQIEATDKDGFLYGGLDIPVCNRLGHTLTIGKCNKFEIE